MHEYKGGMKITTSLLLPPSFPPFFPPSFPLHKRTGFEVEVKEGLVVVIARLSVVSDPSPGGRYEER